jgi:UDP-2,3-diacylglucosamine pyrophosphatase LpxH
MRYRIALVLAVSVITSSVGAQSINTKPASTAEIFVKPTNDRPRLMAVISDLHAGIGRKPDGSWHETEDFRWEAEIEAFLSALSEKGKDRVDLIIAGDLLELWQPPKKQECKIVSDDLSCSVSEMGNIIASILAAQPRLIKALKDFAERGDNRLHIIPGNHDSAFLVAHVWEKLAEKLNAKSGRINLVENGVWASADGSVVVEHGHQIGQDLNRYKSWPNITRTFRGEVYLIRPWGENFVQTIFNAKEHAYPIIDNFSPETGGLLYYYMANRGLVGSTTDLARFLVFNFTETSLAQKAAALGEEEVTEQEPGWDINYVRKEKGIGHQLIASALGRDNYYAQAIRANTSKGAELRAELDAMVSNEERLPEPELLMLCDEASQQGDPLCRRPTAGHLVEKILVPRDRVMRSHLKKRLKDYPDMRTFIYGHTHQLEARHLVEDVDKDDKDENGTSISVDVLNSGAFQRIIDEKGYLKRVGSKNPAEELSKLKHDDLPPCYTAILMPAYEDSPHPETVRWHMPNTTGEFVPVGDERCD